MAEVAWTETALFDVDAIADYLSHDSPAMATQIVKEIFLRTEALANFPEIGRMIPEIGENDRREIFCYSYRIMYLIKDRNVYIQAVYHGAREYRP